MIKVLLPVVLALAGLGAGVGAGMALKPEAEADAAGCAEAGAEGEAAVAEGEAEGAAAAATCVVAVAAVAPEGERELVSFDKPFVVPVFRDDRVVAMVVLSLSVEVGAGQVGPVTALQPRLRDGLLAVMFRHANSGGFDGSFTTGEKMSDLKSGLLAAARGVLVGLAVDEVLVTEIVRQDV